MAAALAKAAAALAIVILGGPRPMRAWLRAVARRRSNELFVLNVLLITLVAAFVTGAAGLSLVLGAFLAGMLISETEYRFQVEEDIKPFRDVLLGLFFVTVGMLLDLRLVVGAVLAGARCSSRCWCRQVRADRGAVARVRQPRPAPRCASALALAQGGEFGFVLLALAGIAGVVPRRSCCSRCSPR